MLNALKIKGTDNTPEVIFDPYSEKPVFEISGRSIAEDVVAFYDPLLEWLEKYFESPLNKTIFKFKLHDFNTASSKFLLDILLKLEDLHNNGHDVLVHWHYPNEITDELSELVEIPFINLWEDDNGDDNFITEPKPKKPLPPTLSAYN